MTEKKPSPYAKNFSPTRAAIVKLIEKRPMSASEIAKHFEGYTRERIRNIMHGMAESKLATKIDDPAWKVVWGKFVQPPKPQKRETPVYNGTMREPLNIGFMASPYRAGSMDAYQIRSGGY